MDKTIHILCICNQGNCRSVATRICLNKRGYTNVIAVGGANTSHETMGLLVNWSDIVLIAKPEHQRWITNGKRKIYSKFIIGEDIYDHDPWNPQLHELIEKQLDTIPL